MNEIKIPGLLIIGGSSRNVGKTTLATQLINKYKDEVNITGLKVTSIYPEEKNYHGSHDTALTGDFEILEEKNPEGYKDTSKMLWHGAEAVYYIRAKDHAIFQAMESFLQVLPPDPVIICESISLRQFVKPGLFILIQSTLPHKPKISFQKMLPHADVLINSDKKKFDLDINRIVLEDGKWMIKK